MSSNNSNNNNNNSNFDSLLLQSLMGGLQLRPPYLNTNSYLSQTLEDLLLNANPLDDEDDYNPDDEDDERTLLAKEESKLEKEIIRIILSGKIETLKPNSGQAVSIGEHHICVGYQQEKESDYRVWEWHGHIMLFDEENGYNPEYIYGNYFERVLDKPHTAAAEKPKEKEEEEKEEDDKEGNGGNLGLRELIDGSGGSVAAGGNGRILLRPNMSVAGSR